MVMSQMLVTYFMLFIMALFYHECFANPRCLDYFPPFSLGEGGAFCSEYQNFGCCTAERNRHISVEYNRIVQKLRNDGLSTCTEKVKEILCQECSPYSAQLYGIQSQNGKRDLPGLCNTFCTEFYSTCKNALQYLTKDRHILNTLESASAFCNSMTLTDNSYCYPNLLKDDYLNKQLNRETSAEDDCLCLKKFASGLKKPLTFDSPDDGSKRIFIGSQYGKIFIYYENGTMVDDIFMDITDMVHITSLRGAETGLLGLTFHSYFKVTKKLYVHFITKNSNGDVISRISEFTTMSDNDNKVDHKSMRNIIDIEQPFSLHNAGQLIYGIDGYLYAFLGDGGSQGDPLDTAQDRTNLLGSVIRINVDIDDTKGYTIPSDNPFINVNNVRPEIYAYGFGNPHGADQDEGDPETGFGRGRLFAGDVGHHSWEEINHIFRGGNYGWSAKEGPDCFKDDICKALVSDKAPIYAYNHSVGQAVVGGHVYRGCLNPNLNGLYIYGDYFNGKLFRLKETFQSSNVWENKQLLMCSDSICDHGLTNQYTHNILAFGEDYNGELYIIANNGAREDSGAVYKIIDPRRRGDPETCRSHKNIQANVLTQTVEKKTKLPSWPFWLMAIFSMISFKSGLLCMYAHYKVFPRWSTYRKLAHVTTLDERHRSFRSDQGLTNTDQLQL